jgi:hypothetical protein
MRFCLSYPGWQPIGQDTRATAATLRDWGLLEQSETAPNLFRLALADDRRRELEAFPAMLAALQEAVARVELANSEGDSILSAWLHDARAAIALATGAPTGEAAGDDETACASCGAPEGESHAIGCEARGFAIGAAAARNGGKG